MCFSCIKEIKGAKKFKHVGIEHALKFKYEGMNSNIVITREYVWTPISGVLGDADSVEPSTNNANIDAIDFEEGSGDSKENRNPTFENDISRLVGGVNISSSSITRSSGKRKENDAYDVRAKKKKTFGIDVQLLSRWDQLPESMSTRSNSTSLYMDREGSSICEVMTELHSIPEISIDDDFHDFTI